MTIKERSDDKTSLLGRSAAIVHGLAVVAYGLLTVIRHQLNATVTGESAKTLLAGAGVSFAAFAVFWVWSVSLSIKAASDDENDFWASKVSIAAMIELLIIIVVEA